MTTSQHYTWALGHFVLLVSSLRYFFSWAMFRAPSPWWYKAAFTGALVSYAIVCHNAHRKSLTTHQPIATTLKRALLDENVQYFLMAFFWWTSKPIALALLPYAIFSLFHSLTFTRTNLMPQFLPPGPSATPNGAPTQNPYAKKLQVWIKTNYDPAMRTVAYAELLIMLRVALGALLRRNSLLAPLFYAHFLRQRYYQSAFTREAFATVNARIEGYVRTEGAPPALAQVYDTFKSLLGRWVGTTLAPQQPARAQ